MDHAARLFAIRASMPAHPEDPVRSLRGMINYIRENS
jgi:hypothetical protein